MSDFPPVSHKSAESHEMRALARSVADGWTFRNQLPPLASRCITSFLFDLRSQDRIGLRTRDREAILSR
jgi:hypothetical protein